MRRISSASSSRSAEPQSRRHRFHFNSRRHGHSSRYCWNPAIEDQAADRDKPVFVHNSSRKAQFEVHMLGCSSAQKALAAGIFAGGG
jgi:hypothetical protein